jgi:response regulator RpfG family c-di-GMP phosphodiesterase
VPKALANIRANRGKWFDPRVVDAFMDMRQEQGLILPAQNLLPVVAPIAINELE